MDGPIKSIRVNRTEILFLSGVYLIGLYFRLWPRLGIDPHLLPLNADVWERLAMAQYFLDHGSLPNHCLRYEAYGNVPFWYPPLGPLFLGILAKIFSLDLPTVCSRIMPFIESLTPLPFYFMARWLYNRRAAAIATVVLALTPCFIYWTGIATPTSFTLFALPIYITLLAKRSEYGHPLQIRTRLLWIATMGGLLAINFLTHLTYLLAIAIVAICTWPILAHSPGKKQAATDVAAAVILSQGLTLPWWLPNNLYWWWLFGLTTSTGLQPPGTQLEQYGITAALLGFNSLVAYCWLLRTGERSSLKTQYGWLPVAWIIIPFIEAENELLLLRYHKVMDTCPESYKRTFSL